MSVISPEAPERVDEELSRADRDSQAQRTQQGRRVGLKAVAWVTTGATAVAVSAGLWLGYKWGNGEGKEHERAATVAANGRTDTALLLGQKGLLVHVSKLEAGPHGQTIAFLSDNPRNPRAFSTPVIVDKRGELDVTIGTSLDPDLSHLHAASPADADKMLQTLDAMHVADPSTDGTTPNK